jgi:hypothetical protein
MSKKFYNWLTNAGMLLGILSAWLYQRAEVSHVVAITVALVAASLSIGTYFYDRFSAKYEEKAEVPNTPNTVITNEMGHTIVSEVTPARRMQLVLNHEHEIMLAENQAATQRALVDRIRELGSIMETHRNAEMGRTAAFMQHYVQHNNAGRRLRYRYPTDKRLMEPEVEMSSREAAVCYKQIMRDIVDSTDDMEWDFTVDTKGLRVSGKKHHPRPVLSAQLDEIMLEQETDEAAEEDSREYLS